MPDSINPLNQPLLPDGPNDPDGKQPAVDLIRQKLNSLYDEEPSAGDELQQAEHHTHPGSKHQDFMNRLHATGRSMPEIQSAWHAYYMGLPDKEKHEVWQEFYSRTGGLQGQAASHAQAVTQAYTGHGGGGAHHSQAAQHLQAQAAHHEQMNRAHEPVHSTVRHRSIHRRAKHAAAKHIQTAKRLIGPETDADGPVSNTARKANRKRHLHSLVFGLACGAVVLVIFLFGLFNEFIITPFIQPSRKAVTTPVIVDVASTIVGGGPKILIPKINLEIPVDYNQTTIDEKNIELALDNGVVHYPTTSKPGQAGNAAFFGHSSNNILNPGKYKFAFLFLKDLQEGDTFYLSYESKTYAYRVFQKRIVKPSEVSVLQPIVGKTSTATLITCDPPGTSINRLIVVGEQISPDPNGNPVPAENIPAETASADNTLPGNGPTLLARIWGSIF